MALRQSSIWLKLMILFVLAGGLAVRLFDLPDPPLGFHPTRQMRGALIARYLYFRWDPPQDLHRVQVVTQVVRERLEAYEAPILETLVALTYLLLGREALWVARLYSVLFWTLTGWLVFRWAWRATGEPWAGWGALAYLMALPFSVKASRAFQPDPLMTLLITMTGYMWWSWSQTKRHRDLVLGTGAAALACLVKPFAVYFITPLLAAWAWMQWREKSWNPRRVLAITVFTFLPLGLFILLSRRETAGAYWQQWTWTLRHLWTDPKFLPRWMRFLAGLTGTGWPLLALVGWTLASGAFQGFLTAWLVGYGLYGLLLPYQITSHNYYHLPFFPWIALGIGAAVAALLPQWRQRGGWWPGLALLAAWAWILYGFAEGYTDLQDTWWDEAAHYQQVGEVLPREGRLIGLVEHYGFPLAYYGERVVIPWPSRAEQALARLRGKNPRPILQAFQERVEGFDYFVVTDFREWETQPALREVLTTFCPLTYQGDEVLIFDLKACRLAGDE